MKKIKIFLFNLPLCVSFLVFDGCAQVDPLYSSFSWNSSSANAKNLSLQVENTKDLSSGKYEQEHDISLGAEAVKRLREGKVKPLQDAALSKVGNSQGASSKDQ